MCGIAGYIGGGDMTGKASVMARAILHRGPDDEGIFTDDAARLALAFRRLAIQDLSPAGHQPMNSSSGRYTIVFNGEIYNFPELRKKLEASGYAFKGGSDTEVMLAGFEEWGLEKALEAFNGMFAFALYDRRERRLHLVRDRIGKKPLYYGTGPDGFYFASEMKAILAALPQSPSIDHDVAALYFRWRYVPDPYCIYSGFHKLTPGHVLTINLDDMSQRMRPFWKMAEITARSPSFKGGEKEAINRLEEILKAATARRMVADVPLGAFLSGGIDSSLIVALMQQHQQTRTFTIAFEDKKYNEAEYARAVARHLGTTHEEMMVTAEDALKTVPLLPRMFDEPFADPSAIPTYQVCRLARTKMTVALSGDGGDESFGGYSWYARAEKINKIPSALRMAGGLLAAHLPLSPQALKLASVMSASCDEARYAALHSYWQTADLLDYKPVSLPLPMDGMKGGLMAYDSAMFLPGDVLTKVDRASMAVSLEVRSPLLDREVVEFAWSLPPEMRRGKKLLRRLLGRYLPDELIDRPKQGFSVPHGAWLRGPLKSWAGELLHQPHDYFKPAALEKIWQAHQSGRADYGHLLWTVIMFQSWYAVNKKGFCHAVKAA